MKISTQYFNANYKCSESIHSTACRIINYFPPSLQSCVVEAKATGTLNAALWNCNHSPAAPQQQCPAQGDGVVSADRGCITSFPEGNPEGQQGCNDLGQLGQVNSHLSNDESTATKYTSKSMLMFFLQPWKLHKPSSSSQELSQIQETILYVVKT